MLWQYFSEPVKEKIKVKLFSIQQDNDMDQLIKAFMKAVLRYAVIFVIQTGHLYRQLSAILDKHFVMFEISVDDESIEHSELDNY